jgi:hypothetical protein
MTLTGLSKMLFYRPSATIVPGNTSIQVGCVPGFVAALFVIEKEFLIRHPFPDMNEGADTVFSPGA